MELSIEREDNRLIVGSKKRNHTVMNLIKQAVWDAGGRAGYDKGHPYRGESKLVITADNADDLLNEAISKVQEDLESFSSAFESA